MVMRGHLFRVLRRSLNVRIAAIADKLLATKNSGNHVFQGTSISVITKAENMNKIIPIIWIDILCELSNMSKEELYERASLLEPDLPQLYKDRTNTKWVRRNEIHKKREVKAGEWAI